MALAVGLD